MRVPSVNIPAPLSSPDQSSLQLYQPSDTRYEVTSHKSHIMSLDYSNPRLDMTAVSIVGLIALIIFTCFLVTVTIIVVRHRRREGDGAKNTTGDLEQYRRVPLIPLDTGATLCCDTAASSTKSCSCYSR